MSNPEQPTLYIFLTEECPICQHYGLALSELHDEFSDQIDMIGVFPNETSNDQSIESFMKKYRLPFSYVIDHDHQLREKFSATVTPEVILMEEEEILYRGAIDDSFAAVGKRRRHQKLTPFLQNALLEFLSENEITLDETKPVGCVINKVQVK